MNKVILVGRFTKDPETRSNESTTILSGTLAVDRKYKKDGETSADFPRIVAFGKTAEFISKYFTKGMKIAIIGHIQTGSYEKDGQKIYTTDVVVDEAEFVEKKNQDLMQEGGIATDEFVTAGDDVSAVFNF